MNKKSFITILFSLLFLSGSHAFLDARGGHGGGRHGGGSHSRGHGGGHHGGHHAGRSHHGGGGHHGHHNNGGHGWHGGGYGGTGWGGGWGVPAVIGGTLVGAAGLAATNRGYPVYNTEGEPYPVYVDSDSSTGGYYDSNGNPCNPATSTDCQYYE